MLFKLLLTVIFVLPITAFAHGGVEKQSGNTTVYLTQSPLSPIVGETVQFTLVFNKGENIERLKNYPVTLSLIDTFYGDESKDKIILTQEQQTDVNGAISFEYTFNKENYFDVDLKFKDPVTGENQDTGFLIQPRIAINSGVNYWQLLVAGIMGLILGAVAYKFRINNRR